MAMTLKRPLLIGGLGLTASLWMLDTLRDMPIDGSMVMGAIALGSGLWWFKQRNKPNINLTIPQLAVVSQDAVDQALGQVDSLLEILLSEFADQAAALQQPVEQLRQTRAAILENLERDHLKISLVGNPATGKSALVEQLKAAWSPRQTLGFAELTLAALDDTVTQLDSEKKLDSTKIDIESDLVLFAIAGDLTESERQTLQALVTQGHQVLLVFNKQDQYTPMDREVVLERVRSRVQPMGIEVVSAAAVPNPVKVCRHLESGEIEESFEQPAPELVALTQQLTTLTGDSALLMATGLRQANALKLDVIGLLNQQRRQKAMPVVEQMQWIAAGTAFANPLATLDLLASVAINAQLILDLGKIYGQKFSLDQAKTAAGTLAELTVKLGLVELATQALGTVLKGHAATYLAGGALQGVSAAYLTRVAGLTLIDCFEAQSWLDPADRQLSFDALGERLQGIFQQARQGMALQAFVTQALKHLPIGNPSAPPSPASAAGALL
ncbi:MAG: DUF697 domain-containing protein [Cyanobacteria bacterium P01_F01_bin.4]